MIAETEKLKYRKEKLEIESAILNKFGSTSIKLKYINESKKRYRMWLLYGADPKKMNMDCPVLYQFVYFNFINGNITNIRYSHRNPYVLLDSKDLKEELK